MSDYWKKDGTDQNLNYIRKNNQLNKTGGIKNGKRPKTQHRSRD